MSAGISKPQAVGHTKPTVTLYLFALFNTLAELFTPHC